jgi:hypothetical protein
MLGFEVLIGKSMKVTIFLELTLYNPIYVHQHTASIFRVEEESKQATSTKQNLTFIGCPIPFFVYLLGFLLEPEDGGSSFLP